MGRHNLKIAPRPKRLENLDDRIFDYPILLRRRARLHGLSQPNKPRACVNTSCVADFIFFDDFLGRV
jgi:hypothetical protein